MVESSFSQQFLIPLLVAFVCGSILGLEREMSHRPAGLKTQTLITIGTVIFVLAAKLLGAETARIAANVLTGLGFIGGGVILQHKGTARGLTTAALIWVNGGLGLAIGLNEYRLAIVGVLLTLIVLRVLGFVEAKIKTKCHVQYYCVTAKENEAIVTLIHEALQKCHFQEEPLSFQKTKEGIEMRFAFCNPPQRHQEFIEKLRKIKEVLGVKKG